MKKLALDYEGTLRLKPLLQVKPGQDRVQKAGPNK